MRSTRLHGCVRACVRACCLHHRRNGARRAGKQLAEDAVLGVKAQLAAEGEAHKKTKEELQAAQEAA